MSSSTKQLLAQGGNWKREEEHRTRRALPKSPERFRRQATGEAQHTAEPLNLEFKVAERRDWHHRSSTASSERDSHPGPSQTPLQVKLETIRQITYIQNDIPTSPQVYLRYLSLLSLSLFQVLHLFCSWDSDARIFSVEVCGSIKQQSRDC